jgi:hypothetical protein
MPPMDQTYSPKVVDRWLRQWPLLDALVESPVTARHHLETFHERTAPHMEEGKPCEEPKGPPMHPSTAWAEFRADMVTAVRRLAPGLEKDVVRLVLRGRSLSAAARELRRNKKTVLDAYQAATYRMAEGLGWEDQSEAFHKESA